MKTEEKLFFTKRKKARSNHCFFDGFQKSAEEVYEIIVKNVPDS